MLSTTTLFFKFMVTTLIQGGKRFKAGSRPPEDAKLSLARGKPQSYGTATDNDNPKLKKAKLDDIRWVRLVLNDLENIPLGLIVFAASIASNGDELINTVALGVFTVSRIFHSIAYAYELQPHRAIGWAGGVLAVSVAAINGVWGALFV
ncbi:hypothetical protein BC833DRAFT_581388 [Globomyces pollinis-pini]|nr:hypothetical protein BC833DRAFT_581388 [Globomyces pollinis-pini]